MEILENVFTNEDFLVSALKAKEKKALEHLFENYSSALNGIIRRFVKDEEAAEELLQDAFIRVYTKIEMYSPEKGRLYTWMANLTRNLCLDYIKSKQFKKSSATTGDETVLTVAFTNESYSQTPETIGIKEVIEKLPSDLQQVIQYAYFKGYTQQEISEELDLPLGTVKTRVRKALLELRKIFN